MNSPVISAGAIAKYQRSDPAFHQAIAGAQPLIQALEGKGMTPQRAQEKLALVPVKFLGPLKPLLTEQEQPTEESLRAAADRHPVEALALVLGLIDDRISDAEEQVQDLNRQELDELPTGGLAQ